MAAQASASTELLRDEARSLTASVADFVQTGVEAEAEGEGEATLKRTLSVTALTLLGVGAVIGTGIFVLTGQAAGRHAGPAVVISMILAGVVSALAALCYSEFASTVPPPGRQGTVAKHARSPISAPVPNGAYILWADRTTKSR